jgi:DNA-binding transcriptional regulator YhcF (GntR family)
VKRFIEDNINGILGTIIFHLFLIIIFLGIRIHSVKRHQTEVVEITFQELPEDYLTPKEEIKKKILEEDGEMNEAQRKNIAVNTAKKVYKDISTEKYIEDVKKELNIVDYQAPDVSDEAILPKSDESPQKKRQASEEAEYSGETNITYYLKERDDRNLPVPVYTCHGGGIVLIGIDVNPEGYVTSASVNEIKEASDPQCLAEAAYEAAMNTRFSVDPSAPRKQEGWIKYHFVAQ